MTDGVASDFHPRQPRSMHLSGLFIYPVKSLRGCAVSTASLDTLGLVGDRRFLVVDENGRFLTQRTLPRMALVETSLDSTHLQLKTPDAFLRVPRHTAPGAEPPPLRTVSVWSSENLLAEDCGDDAAALLTNFLRTSCRLVRIGPAFHRPVAKPGKARPGDLVSFPDAYPFLVVSEASLEELNGRLAREHRAPLPMDRFRPNLVVHGCEPFAEDQWPRFRVGEVVFRAGGPCARCVITTTNQFTAERGKEPLRMLASYRRDADDPTNVNFGQNLFHETKTGVLRVGDRVELL